MNLDHIVVGIAGLCYIVAGFLTRETGLGLAWICWGIGNIIYCVR
jgi:hypothetical protein